MQCQGPGCSNEVQQPVGGHRPRKYCSDRCRVAAHRKHAEEVKDAARKLQATANVLQMWQELIMQYDDLLPAQLALLHLLKKTTWRGDLEKLVGQALVKTFEFATATEQERKDILIGEIMEVGEKLGYPDIEGLGLPAGNDNWWKTLRFQRVEQLRLLCFETCYRCWSPRQEAEELERLRRQDGTYAAYASY